MKKNKGPYDLSLNELFLISIALFLIFGGSEFASARDLVDAATTAQSIFNRIGIAAISIGITLGGILYASGAAFTGRMILMSGFIGALAVLGAPAVISLLTRIFGVST